jgi:DNA invertase Pin-like site-specific DNA recombinase
MKKVVEKENKCICLARVSTERQSYDEQVNNLIETAKRDGYKDSNIIIINNKESGIKLDEEHRLGLNEMKSKIQNDKSINCVYAREASRVGRTEKVLISIKHFLIDNKIQLVFTATNLRLLNDDKTLNPMASMMFNMLIANAQQEMIDKKERFREGKLKAIKEHKFVGPKILFGYAKGDDNVIIINHEQANIVRFIFNAYAYNDESASTIFRELNERGLISNTYSHHTGGVNFIRNVLQNEAYKGGQSNKTKKMPFNYPPIVSEELWEKANAQMKENCKCYHSTKHILYSKGLVECECGYKMIGNVNLTSYRCHNGCGKFVNLNILEYIAWTEAKAAKAEMMGIDCEKNKDLFTQQIADNESKIKTINEQIIKLDGKLSRAYKGYVMGGISENDYQDIVKTIDKERKEFLTTIKNLQDSILTLSELINKQNGFNIGIAYGGVQAITDDNERRKIVKETIDKIIVSDYKDGKLITVIGKDNMKMVGDYVFNQYYYVGSRYPKTYLVFDNIDGEKGFLDISNQVEKRFSRKRY